MLDVMIHMMLMNAVPFVVLYAMCPLYKCDVQKSVSFINYKNKILPEHEIVV
jgi:hypothetical protein